MFIRTKNCSKRREREREREREGERERERVSYKFINSYESIQHVYPSITNTCVSCNSKKNTINQKKKKKQTNKTKQKRRVQERFYGKTIGKYIFLGYRLTPVN